MIMESDKQVGKTEVAGPALAAPKSSSRRLLLRAGLGVSPAVLTIVSSPVRALPIVPQVCRSASSFASLNAAAAANVATSGAPAQMCTGLTPNGWKSLAATTAQAELFSNIFSPPVSLPTITSPTLRNLLVDGDGSTTRAVILARWFTAAYLNHMAGTSPGVFKDGSPGVDQIKAMWVSVYNGTFSPTAGAAVWDDNAVINWLNSTMQGG
jgi:hypothetical protein